MSFITYAEVPDDRVVMEYLGEKFNIAAAKAKVGGHDRFEPASRFGAIPNPDDLFNEVWEFYRGVGATPWQSRKGVAAYGASLYYNPAHAAEQWHTGSFGTPRLLHLPNREYQDAPVRVEKYGGGKADYVDVYAFRRQHPFIKQCLPNLASFLDSFNFPITRVTARTMNGLFHIGGGYHIDTKDSFHIRVNVSLSTDGSFGLSYKDGPLVMFNPGDVHMVCTHRHHSSHAVRKTNFQRTNLVIDVLPWYHYDAVVDGWAPNEYFGRMHPYDMLKEGIITFGGHGGAFQDIV